VLPGARRPLHAAQSGERGDQSIANLSDQHQLAQTLRLPPANRGKLRRLDLILVREPHVGASTQLLDSDPFRPPRRFVGRCRPDKKRRILAELKTPDASIAECRLSATIPLAAGYGPATTPG
jgi:hypothetical protein